MLDVLHSEKRISLEDLPSRIAYIRSLGKTVIQCHGVFDLVHPGHIQHFKEAKALGDFLIVSITSDLYVNKGPGRPVFNQNIRASSLVALEMIDAVVISDNPDAIPIIELIKPDIYVKGSEYSDHEKDITAKIQLEVDAVKRHGGKVHYSQGIVFSSSALINKFLQPLPTKTQKFINKLKEHYTIDDILRSIHDWQRLRVLVVGDAIIDEYQYVDPLGQSGKGVHMTTRLLGRDIFLGGSFAIANHLASFVKQVTLLTAVGTKNMNKSLLQKLDKNVSKEFIFLDESKTLTKRRYVFRDGNTLTKLFETYSEKDYILEAKHTKQICDYLRREHHNYDLIIVSDFGHGTTNPTIRRCISQLPSYLAINAQINSSNRGYNVVTHYKRANYISVNEPELRLTAHDKHSDLELLVKKISKKLKVKQCSVTCGVNGVLVFDTELGFYRVPALAQQTVDRVGAGDSYLAISSLSLAGGAKIELASFLGSIAAAMDVQFIGNKEHIQKTSFCKYLTTLLK